MQSTQPLNRAAPNGEAEAAAQSPSEGQAVMDFFSTDEIFQRVAASADEEFKRSVQLLIFSGIAAGLSIGLSFMTRVAVTARVPGDTSGLIGNLVYPIGFLLIVLGRYQLFTENTLTPVTLVLTRIASIPALLRNWGIVLAANMLGALGMAALLTYTGIFSAEAQTVAIELGEHALGTASGDLFWKGMIAGWLVASMVWLVHAARDSVSRFLIVFFVMYLIPSTDLYHCIIGFCEAMYLVLHGDAALGDAVFSFFVPVLLGNTMGGVLLVAILNYAQTRESRFTDRDCGMLELTWREWLFELHTGAPPEPENPAAVSGKTLPGMLAQGVSDRDHISGPTDAPITLVHYGDYECPTSQHIYQMARELQRYSDVPIRYVYRHFPLRRQHPNAIHAALAAEAAAEQGKFWEMHHMLFSNQHSLDEEDLLANAEALELDMMQFNLALGAESTRKIIEANRRSGLESGIRSTKNLFIGDDLYRGEYTVESIRTVIERRAAPELAR